MPTAPLPIAIVMGSLNPGGTERQMLELVRRLDRRRWRVHVASLRTSGAWLDRVADAAAISFFPISSFRRADTARQAARFASWCRDRRIALVHTADLPSNVFALPAAAVGRVPVRIGNRRELAANKSLWEVLAQRAAYSCAHAVMTNCDAAARRLQRERVPARKIAIVPNGLDLERFPAREPRRTLRRIVCVANLRPEKAHDVLINAAASLLFRVPDAEVELIGDGPERPKLEALANSLGIGGRVTFAGHCDNVAARLRDADVFVLPSHTEALPNAAVEAMAAALPIVASRVGGLVELIEDGRSGLLVPPDDPRTLAESLQRLIANPEFAAQLGASARQTVAARYSFDRMIAGVESLYLTQLTRRGVIAGRDAAGVLDQLPDRLKLNVEG